MLPPQITAATSASGEALRILHDGSDAGGAGALGDQLLLLDQQLDRGLDGAFVDQ